MNDTIHDILDHYNQQGQVWSADDLPADIPVNWRFESPAEMILQAVKLYDARARQDIGTHMPPLVLGFRPASYSVVAAMEETKTLWADGAGKNIHISVVRQ